MLMPPSMLNNLKIIVACVAAGTGVAVVPESVLGTVNSAQVARYPIPKVLADVTTPLVWRTGEDTPAVVALRKVATENVRTTRGAVKDGPRR